MLSIYWGITDDCCYYIDDEYEIVLDYSWFDDPLVKEIVADIDNCKIEALRCTDLDNPKIQFPIDGLSTGSKGLILLAKLDDVINNDTPFRIWGTAFGDNCSKWLLKIAEERNFVLELQHFLQFPSESFKGYSLLQNREFKDYDDYRYEMRHWGCDLW